MLPSQKKNFLCKCIICHDFMKNPSFIVDCGHEYCHGCISQWLDSQKKDDMNQTCPVCRTPVESGLRPSLLLRKIISDIKTTTPVNDDVMELRLENVMMALKKEMIEKLIGNTNPDPNTPTNEIEKFIGDAMSNGEPRPEDATHDTTIVNEVANALRWCILEHLARS